MIGFLESLQNKQPLVFDGAMGSMLAQAGLTESAGLANIEHPQQVYDIHRAYIEAGAQCLITNTLTLNSVYMKKAGQAALLEKSLYAGIEQALKAAEGKVFVFGDMGPAGELLKPYGSGDSGAFYEAYCQQAAVFAETALSGIIIETVFSLAEAQIMLNACRDAAPCLPVILSMTFAKTKDGGRTMMGDKAVDIAVTAKQAGACAVGANCGDLYPQEFAVVMQAMAPAGLPLIAQPNAGKPQLCAGKVVYDLDPNSFAADMLALRTAGASMLGGCCGTTPAHIAALTKAVMQ
ncbi:MAG: homocysteine S-methyltransferase family protein [Firmicutes bacterium]|nr:homocysteine S-methyltransferase family protein [Bacillota bacterium]